jgi:hypothetical protein
VTTLSGWRRPHGIDLGHEILKFIVHPSNPAIQASVLAAGGRKGACRVSGRRGDIEQIVRLENLAARSVRRLGIKAGDAVAAPPNPAEYLARRAAERAGKPSGDPA